MAPSHPSDEPPLFSVVSQRNGTGHRISPSGELDLATVQALEAEMLRVEETDAETITLDLSGLTFMDTAGLHMLMRAAARSRSDRSRLRLIKGIAGVHRLVVLVGAEDELPFIVETLDES
jgi:anti-anti-sigma factor